MVCLGQFFMFIFLSSNSNTLHTDIYSFCKNNFHFTPVNTKGHHQNPHRCKGDSCPSGLSDFIYIIFHPTFPSHFLFFGINFFQCTLYSCFPVSQISAAHDRISYNVSIFIYKECCRERL